MLPKIIDLTESLHTPRNYFTFHLLTPGISLSKLSLLTGEFMGATGEPLPTMGKISQSTQPPGGGMCCCRTGL